MVGDVVDALRGPDPPDPFRDAIQRIVGGLAASPGAHGVGRDVDAALEALASAGFEAARVDVLRWTHEFDSEGIRALFASFSPVLVLDPDDRDRVLDGIERVAADEFDGHVVKPILTTLFTARKPA
jgi:hypothetical protein